jgi:hypothetical protein
MQVTSIPSLALKEVKFHIIILWFVIPDYMASLPSTVECEMECLLSYLVSYIENYRVT